MEKLENEEDYTFPTFNGMNRPAMMYGIPMMIGLIVMIYIVLTGFIGFQMGLGKFALIAPGLGVIFLIIVKVICQDDPNAFAILKWKFKAILLKLNQQNPIIYLSSNGKTREVYNARRSFKKI
ncbi:VirB3 family type IV secretion system protein [Rodentibacter caecimuris]|uniref:VirB3 family type IV secretion system protein n=1 Tax=Rodentibacter caecimuris TaxID=1796644 RepID=UPI002119B9DF|nr:VirB3 family type IV secretion system protein [Rodentibacter heylii]MCQ9124681.1 VirB3 family type IV secretion system protein [Rodentibacter heylii]